jgi:hypothetical protein
MKWISTLGLCLALLPPKATAQAPAQPTQTAARAEPANASDHDKNIEAYISLMRADLRKQKSEVMAEVMQLDADGAAKFWPIYRDFEVELSQFYDQVGAMIKNYSAQYPNMTNEVADQLGTKALDLEQQRNVMKRKYYTRFKTALDSFVATRFLQVENQIERIIDLQIAAELPIVVRSGG